MRRPVALATAAVVTAMLIPAGAAAADTGDTDTGAVVDTQPVADPEPQQSDSQPDPQDPVPGSPASEQETPPTTDTPAPAGDQPDADAPTGTDVPTGTDTGLPADSDAPADTDVPGDTDVPTDTDAPAGTQPDAEQPSAGSTSPDEGGENTEQDPGGTDVVAGGIVFRGLTALGGPARIGTTITPEPTSQWPDDTTWLFQWYSPSTNGWVTAPSYTLGQGDVDGTVLLNIQRFEYEAGRVDAYTVTLTSQVVDPDAPAEMVPGTVTVEGFERSPAPGATLTATPRDWPENTEFSYRWLVQGEERSTSGTFTPTAGDLGRYVTLVTTASLAGHKSVETWEYPGVVTTAPTVTVTAEDVTVRQDATVSVRVAGPQGGPVPTGTVMLTLTARDGGTVRTFPGVPLVDGAASSAVPGLAPGIWDITASYEPKEIIWSYVAGSTALSAQHSGPYLAAEGYGAVAVQKVAPTISAPTTITTPVATRSVVQASAVATGVPVHAGWTLRDATSRAVVAQGTVGKDGAIAATVPVLAPGTHWLLLEVAEGVETTSASHVLALVVAGEPPQVGGAPTAVLESPKSATSAGQQMELVAEGFEPGEVVAFYLHSDPVFLGTAVADANGVARLLASIPADVPTGSHTVLATGGTSGRWATLAVTLATPVDTVVPVAAPAAAVPAAADPAAVPAAGELAVTGSQSGLLLAGSWLMLLVGGGLVLVARRVRAAR